MGVWNFCPVLWKCMLVCAVLTNGSERVIPQKWPFSTSSTAHGSERERASGGSFCFSLHEWRAGGRLMFMIQQTAARGREQHNLNLVLIPKSSLLLPKLKAVLIPLPTYLFEKQEPSPCSGPAELVQRNSRPPYTQTGDSFRLHLQSESQRTDWV